MPEVRLTAEHISKITMPIIESEEQKLKNLLAQLQSLDEQREHIMRQIELISEPVRTPHKKKAVKKRVYRKKAVKKKAVKRRTSRKAS